MNESEKRKVRTDFQFRLKNLSTGKYLSIEENNQETYPNLSEKTNINGKWQFKSIYDWKKLRIIEIEQLFILINSSKRLALQSKENNSKVPEFALSDSITESCYFRLHRVNPTVL